MRVWALATLLVVAWAADCVYAHGGGGFRGPSGGVPPGLREPPDPGPPPPPSAGWKYFRHWWNENRETILDRKARLLADPTRTFVPGMPPSPIRVRRLERVRDRAILPVLHRFLAAEATPPRARLAALRSLGRCGGSEEAALLIDLVDRTEPGASEELHTALAALGRVRAVNSGRLHRCAFAVLRDPMRTARTRVAAAVTLGLQGDAGVSRQLTDLLRNEPLPREVKHAVVLAMGWIGDSSARKTLESLAYGLPLRTRLFDERLRACAVHALGLIGDDRSIPILVRILGPVGAPEEVRAATLLALGNFPHAPHLPSIVRDFSLQDRKRPQLAHCATLALARFDHPDVEPTLLKLLQRGKWEAQEYAALALGMRAARDFRRDRVDPVQLARVRKALRESKGVHSLARGIALALARDPLLGREMLGEAPHEAWGHRYGQYVATLAETLAQRRPSIVRKLEGWIVSAKKADVNVASVRALASLGPIDVKRMLRDPFFEAYDYDKIRTPLVAAGYTADPIAIPFLVEVLLDPKRSPKQREAAADALGRIGDVRMHDPLGRLRARSPFPIGFLGFDEPAWN